MESCKRICKNDMKNNIETDMYLLIFVLCVLSLFAHVDPLPLHFTQTVFVDIFLFVLSFLCSANFFHAFFFLLFLISFASRLLYTIFMYTPNYDSIPVCRKLAEPVMLNARTCVRCVPITVSFGMFVA